MFTKELVAVKIMNSTNKEDFNRKVQEIKILEKLKSIKNIVHIFHYIFNEEEEINEENHLHTSIIYVIMELAECTLNQLIRK